MTCDEAIIRTRRGTAYQPFVPTVSASNRAVSIVDKFKPLNSVPSPSLAERSSDNWFPRHKAIHFPCGIVVTIGWPHERPYSIRYFNRCGFIGEI